MAYSALKKSSFEKEKRIKVKIPKKNVNQVCTNKSKFYKNNQNKHFKTISKSLKKIIKKNGG